jgi:X-linked retinitis pigmentosa GTPase regulator
VIVRKIDAGHHSACISERGNLYIWGTGVFGEFLTPKLVPGVLVREVSVGGCFGAAVDFNGSVWTWGSNTSGECGQGGYDQISAPQAVKYLKKKFIRSLSCGGNFVIALGDDLSKS